MGPAQSGRPDDKLREPQRMKRLRARAVALRGPLRGHLKVEGVVTLRRCGFPSR